MITKILNNYYRKILQRLINDFLLKYRMDKKFVNNDYGFCLFIKRKEYNDEQYEILFTFDKELYLYCIANYQDLKKELDISVKQYFEETRE